MEKKSSLMLMSQHLELSSTVGTKAQAKCHLPGNAETRTPVPDARFNITSATSPAH